MTSEAMNDELHASDLLFLLSQNTRLAREVPHPTIPVHKSPSILLEKQIYQKLKQTSLSKIHRELN